MKSEPVLIIMSILAALQVAAGSAALTDVLSKNVVGIVIVTIAALQGGLQFYLREKVTPAAKVVSYVERDPQGNEYVFSGERSVPYVPERALIEDDGNQPQLDV